MKKYIFGLCILVLTMVCVAGCGKKKNEVEVLIQNYQEALNKGQFELAENYCQFSNGERGSYEDFITDDNDIAYIAASKQLYLEMIEFDVHSVDINGDDAVAYATYTSLDVQRFVSSFPSRYEPEQLIQCSYDECIELLRPDAENFKYSEDIQIICKKINGEWKIVD